MNGLHNDPIVMYGKYRYLCDGEHFATESWSLSRRGEGFLLSAEIERHVAEDWHVFPGSPKENSLHVSLTKDGRPANAEITLRFDEGSARGTYRFAIGGVQAEITGRDGKNGKHELLLPRGYVPVPNHISANEFLWRVFQKNKGEPLPVITYWINVFDTQQAPAPLLSGVRIDYTLAGAGTETIQVPAGEFKALHLVQQYRNRGKALDQHGWFTEDGINILWAYTNDDREWRYELVEFQS